MDDFNPDWASPPGATVADVMIAKGISVYDLAAGTDMSDTDVIFLLIGHLRLTEAIAEGLARVLGGTVDFWLSREERYREHFHQS